MKLLTLVKQWEADLPRKDEKLPNEDKEPSKEEQQIGEEKQEPMKDEEQLRSNC